MTAQVTSFIARRWCVPEAEVHVELDRLSGGLESAVARATVKPDGGRLGAPAQFVVKELRPGFEREADVYEHLWAHVAEPPAVRLLGRDDAERATYLYLEDARAISSWPWSDTGLAAEVCRALARLHDRAAAADDAIFASGYEAELARSAHSTLELALTAVDTNGRRFWRRIGDLRRIVAALPQIRAHLLSRATTFIHGDVHPGNVILRGAQPSPDVVLIDWARARLGSPLEDIASWLHSLGCWEPQARRRHDTLMRAYLEARQNPRPFAADLRLDYWLASASNGLSGAIRYHLAVLGNRASSDVDRRNSDRALVAWERVARRAASLVRTSLGRCS